MVFSYRIGLASTNNCRQVAVRPGRRCSTTVSFTPMVSLDAEARGFSSVDLGAMMIWNACSPIHSCRIARRISTGNCRKLDAACSSLGAFILQYRRKQEKAGSCIVMMLRLCTTLSFYTNLDNVRLAEISWSQLGKEMFRDLLCILRHAYRELRFAKDPLGRLDAHANMVA